MHGRVVFGEALTLTPAWSANGRKSREKVHAKIGDEVVASGVHIFKVLRNNFGDHVGIKGATFFFGASSSLSARATLLSYACLNLKEMATPPPKQSRAFFLYLICHCHAYLIIAATLTTSLFHFRITCLEHGATNWTTQRRAPCYHMLSFSPIWTQHQRFPKAYTCAPQISTIQEPSLASSPSRHQSHRSGPCLD